MDPPPKRRKFFQRAQGTFEGVLRFSEHPITHTMAPNNKDPLGKQLPLRAAMAQSRWTLCATTRKDAAPQGQERHKPHRLHPRQLDINGAAAPVQTTVASYIDVVLDSDGTSIGNVLVPAESTVFSVDGYGPITLDNYNPPNPTPASSRPTSRPHGRSHAAQQTMQPESQETQQGSPNAAASPSSPTPMTIQVPGSSSQAILSSPPTPLPPNPSSSTNSSSSLTASESYFGSTSSQTSSAPDTASPQTTGTAFAPQGNSTTSCKSIRYTLPRIKTDSKSSCHFVADGLGLNTCNHLPSHLHANIKFHFIFLLIF